MAEAFFVQQNGEVNTTYHNRGVIEMNHLNEDCPLAPARGCLYGILFSLPLWIFIGLLAGQFT